MADVFRSWDHGFSLYGGLCFQELRGVELWRVELGQDKHHITHVVGKHPGEHVHSQGVVLGDRSVQYKYLNPNLLAVTTEDKESGKEGKCTPTLTYWLSPLRTGKVARKVSVHQP